MTKKKKLSDEERRSNLRNSQDKYRQRIRRFTFQFSLKDTDAQQWFEVQPDKGNYLKKLILADRQREMIRLKQERAESYVNRSVAEFISDFPQDTLDLLTPDGYIILNPEIIDEAKKNGKVYLHLGSSDTHYETELCVILSQRILSINPKDDSSDYYYALSDREVNP